LEDISMTDNFLHKTNLITAVSDNDFEKFVKFMDVDDVNQCDNTGFAPIHYAVALNANTRILEMLIGMDANVNQEVSYRIGVETLTPLIMSIQNNFNAAAKLLITAKADVNKTHEERYKSYLSESPLHIAVANNNYEIAQTLLENGADVNSEKKLYNKIQFALHIAVAQNNLAMVELLLNNGANYLLKDSDGNLPRDIARNPDIINFMDNFSFQKVQAIASLETKEETKNFKCEKIYPQHCNLQLVG